MDILKVVVLLGNYHPKDMKLIQFTLRANRIPFEKFENQDDCTSYFERHLQETNGVPESHLLLTDMDDREFLKYLSSHYSFCLNAVMIGENLETIFADEHLFNTINCFIARNDPNNMYFPNQVMGAIHRIFTHDIFGLRHFMHGSYTSFSRIINSTKEAQLTVTEISEYVHSICRNDSMSTQVEGVCDELIMNALYDANPKYESEARNAHFDLGEKEKIIVNYGCDGRMFAISVTDQFGRLGKDTIFQYLRRCFFDKDNMISNDVGGAGLGFYRILNAVNSLVINVIENKKTEVIGILDISLNRKAFQQVNKSFYYLKV